jgi:hypothetical protein
MTKSNVFLFIFFLLTFIAENKAQQLTLSATFRRSAAEPTVALEDRAVCPLVDIIYDIYSYNKVCHEITVLNGDIMIPITDAGVVTIRWRDSSNCKIVIKQKGGTDCANSAPSRTFSPIVLSLAGTTPAIVQSPTG